MATKVLLLNGVPTSLLVELREQGIKSIEFDLVSIEKLREILNTSLEVINSIRHPSTKEAVLSLLENKNKVREVQFISAKDIGRDDYIMVVAPKQLQQRGAEQMVSLEDLIIIRLYF